jgi:predicted metal-dependent phosphoesterase TrpH
MSVPTTMLRCDLHLHSFRSHDSNTGLDKIIRTCLERGINCVALTDHNSFASALELQRLAPFPVIPGEEVMTTEGEIIGLFLQEEIPRGMSPGATAEEIKRQGGVVYIPHPFDRLRKGPLAREALLEIIDMVDVVETFNSRITLMEDVRAAEQFAATHGKLKGAGSDAHVWWELGRSYVEMEQFEGKDGFLASLARGRVAGRLSSPAVHFFSSYSKLRKKYLR